LTDPHLLENQQIAGLAFRGAAGINIELCLQCLAAPETILAGRMTNLDFLGKT
jgi:hypothetical protein